MNTEKIFWDAFEGELEKQGAGWGQIGTFLRGMFQKAAPYAQRAGAWVGRSRPAQWLGRHPRMSKLVGFAGTQAAAGAAAQAVMTPFEQRKKIIQVLPERRQSPFPYPEES